MLDYLRILLNARFAKEERGASAVEYGLLIAGIAALIVLVVFAFGGTIQSVFQDTCDSTRRAAAAAPAPEHCHSTQRALERSSTWTTTTPLAGAATSGALQPWSTGC